MKRCHDTAIMAVVYPGLEPWLPAFVESVNQQSDKAFDILLFQDGYTETLDFLPDFNVVPVRAQENLSIAKNREYCINFARQQGYRNLIFCDADDYFSENRVKLLKKSLEHHDIAFNDLTLIDQSEKVLHPRVFSSRMLPSEVVTIEDIMVHNLLGFTHTAIRLTRLEHFSVPEDILAVDWFLFSQLLAGGATVEFVEDAVTYYRQFENNLVGMFTEFDEKALNLGLRVKQRHYTSLLQLPVVQTQHELQSSLQKRLEEMTTLASQLTSIGHQRYIERINKHYNEIYQGWWSLVLPIQQWDKIDE